MDKSTLDAYTLRDKGMTYLTKGKEIFNEGKNVGEKEAGYNVYKKGLEMLMQYLKAETNTEIRNAVKENMKQWIQDGTKMSAQIDSDKGTLPAPKKQASDGGYSKSDIVKPTPKNDEDSSKKYNQDSKPSGGKKDDEEAKKLKTKDDESDKLQNALMSAIVTEKPNVKWEDIAGLENAKKALQEAVILPIKYPQFFDNVRTPWKGILLYGPPGTGKTYLAKACATEAEGTFFSVSSADLVSKWVGESEKLIKTLFNMAREKKPAIIFIDEIDSLVSNRSDGENEASRRVKTEFLVQMQGVGNDDKGILVLGATNIPWGLDPAIRRRFEKRIYIPLPEQNAREYLVRKLANKTKHTLTEEDFAELGERTEGFSGADISILVRDACYEPLRKAQNALAFKPVGYNASGNHIYEPCAPSEFGAVQKRMYDFGSDEIQLPLVSMDDFCTVLMRCKPSVGPNDMKMHQEFTEKFGQEG
eukprot:CAMPEP_0176443436 /NCGR_PEP_ID=MMETSP0127-20121128/22419_1 /TAXON_ID=938130 /ORGANISM="Platyophrya macrostoma, Strain WH" /LENGTH=472 /DNA_ID=CAMNT_0017828659 /DNA_START=66 /DNA_END=1484 /DNA_ORIENTATION=-